MVVCISYRRGNSMTQHIRHNTCWNMWLCIIATEGGGVGGMIRNFLKDLLCISDVMHIRNSPTNIFDSCIDLFLSGINSVYYLLLCKCPSLSDTQKSSLKRLALNNWCFWHLHHAYSKRGFSPKFGLRVSLTSHVFRAARMRPEWFLVFWFI